MMLFSFVVSPSCLLPYTFAHSHHPAAIHLLFTHSHQLATDIQQPFIVLNTMPKSSNTTFSCMMQAAANANYGKRMKARESVRCLTAAVSSVCVIHYIAVVIHLAHLQTLSIQMSPEKKVCLHLHCWLQEVSVYLYCYCCFNYNFSSYR